MKNMKERFKKWFIMSALIDFQDGNNLYLGFISLLIFSTILEYNVMIGFISLIIMIIFNRKYHEKGRKYYHYGICDFYKVKPKTRNLVFKKSDF